MNAHRAVAAVVICTLTMASPKAFGQTTQPASDASNAAAARRPNIVLVLSDDLGFGDVGAYGATKVKTPNLDRLASQGLRFTDAHSPTATCTPSRYGILTGRYPWRQAGTGILPGDASLIVPTDGSALPALLKRAGYTTAAVGKWHLGLGEPGKPVDWNGPITPGPREVGFDYTFILPATGDRVPCVYMEQDRVVGIDPNDPIRVSYREKVGDEPTGRENPDQLVMKLSRTHDGTIVNGISRLGWMSGGQSARWDDETMADTITGKAVSFVEQNRDKPFFLYFATHDIHVPRVPAKRWQGTSECGVRGDVIQQLDGSVGDLMAALDRIGVAENTIFIFTSDNGPVVNDGYADGARQNLNGHMPAGPWRGQKYQIWEAGTRVPFIVRWPGRVKAGTTSAALVGQIDTLGTLGKLAGVPVPSGLDSIDASKAWLGEDAVGREQLVVQANNGLAIRMNQWKYIGPLGNRNGAPSGPQLYDLATDPAEAKNVLENEPERAAAGRQALIDAGADARAGARPAEAE